MSSDSSANFDASALAATGTSHAAIDIVSDSDTSDETSVDGTAGGPAEDARGSSGTPAPHGAGVSDEEHGAMEEQHHEPMVPVSTSMILDRSTVKQQILQGLEPAEFKVTLRFKPIGSTPPITPQVFRISSRQTVATVTSFLCKRLKRNLVYVYLQSSFQPGPDETLGNMYHAFRSGSELVINYCNTIAFG